MKECLIGLDIGTSAVKGALVTTEGEVLGVAGAPFVYRFEEGAKVIDAEPFVDTCLGVIKELAGRTELTVSALCSCCASGNPVFLGEELTPITPIIGWQTQVAQEDLDQVYTPEEQEAFYRVVGWPLEHGMPAANLAWVKLHKPEILEKTRFLAMSAEYLNYQLTGRWGLSHSMATPSFLVVQETGEYNLPLLAKFGLTKEQVPPVYDKGTVLGTVKPEMAQKLGLSARTQVVLGSFDHPSGALGAGVLEEGDLLLSCGTSWVELFPVATREFGLSTGGLVDRFMLNGPPYCVMESVASISEKIDARREHFFGKVPQKVFDAYVAAGVSGAHGLRIDFTDHDFARAEGHSKEDIARAIIEGAALLFKDNLAKLERSGLIARNITAIGGITNSPICTAVISEVLGQEIKVVNGQSAGAVGSALLAGIGTGWFAGEREAFAAMKAHLDKAAEEAAAIAAAKASAEAAAREAFRIESECIREMAEVFDPAAYQKAVELLIAAPRIGASGCGHSGILCQHFAHLMCCIEQPAKFISPAEAVHGGTGFLQAGDVCVLASRGGKTAELLPIMRICREKGVKIITITENLDSPLATGADVVLKQHVNRETDRYNCQGTTSSTALA